MKFNIKSICVRTQYSIIDTMKHIDTCGKGIVYVVNDEKKLIGTITDGDIRRAIIDGAKINDSIDKFVNRNPVKANENFSNEQMKQLMIQKAVRELPIVNGNNEFIDTVSLNELIIPKGKNNMVLIMAGGLGTRLKELTKEIPKPMLNLGDRPIMQHIIERFKISGFNKFLVSVNYKSEIIENYFQDGSNYECTIEYLKEKQRMGTAGAITLAKHKIKDDFFVINGDIYCTVDLNKVMNFHKENNNDVTIVSVKRSVSVPYGVLNISGNDINAITEKPNYEFLISGGIYCLSPGIMSLIPEGQYYEITDLFNVCLSKGLKVRHYTMEDYWIDIGRIEDYNKINNEIYDLICCEKEGSLNE